MPTNAELQAAFVAMIAAKNALFVMSETELTARENLRTAEYEAIQDGKIDGKNEQIRKAQLAEIVEAEQDALYAAEKTKRGAQLEFDVASMKVDCMKWAIRNEMAAAALEDARLAVV